MIDLQIKNSDNSNGLKRGMHYLPYVQLLPNWAVGLTKRSDGTTDANGILYPTGLNNSTNLGNIRDFIANASGLSVPGLGTDSQQITNNQTKSLVADEYFAKYKRLIYASLHTGIKGGQTFAATNPTDIFKLIQLDSTRAVALYGFGGSGTGRIYLYAQVVQRGVDDVLTYGSSVQLADMSNTVSKETVDGVLINTDKVFLVFNNTSAAQGRVLTISGTTITAGTAVNIGNTATLYVTGGVTKLDTDKVILTFNEGGTSYARVCTVSGSTITSGSTVSLGSKTSPYVIGNSTVQAFHICNNGSDTMGRVLDISGTTITANTEATVIAGYACVRRHQFTKVSSTKFLVLASDDNGHICTISGTSFSVAHSGLSAGLISVSGNAVGAIVEITAGTTYKYYQGTPATVRNFTISGTSVTEGTAETLMTDSNNLYKIFADIWGSDIGILSINASNNTLYIYIAAAGNSSYELYSDATLISGTITDTNSFVARTTALNTAINSKKFYFGIKNKSGATRYFKLTDMMVEVK
jgi:hypothetical protein